MIRGWSTVLRQFVCRYDIQSERMSAVQLVGLRHHSQFLRLLRGFILKTQTANGQCTSASDTRVVIQDEEDFEEEFLSESELERKRDKSRLKAQHRNMLHGQVPYSEPKAQIHKTVKYRRKLYGTYGQNSGVNMGICWPTKAELQDIKEYESVCHPFTLQEMMKEAKEKRAAEEEAIRMREEEIDRKMENLEKWNQELQEKIRKKEAEALAAKAKKDRLVEEVRRHFGYKVDPRNEKFQEMLEQKEKAEKKRLKEERKKAREAQNIARLTQMSQELGLPKGEEKA